jgi:hypothetical protein
MEKMQLFDGKTGFRPSSAEDEPNNIANDTHFNPGRHIGGDDMSLNKTLAASNTGQTRKLC